MAERRAGARRGGQLLGFDSLYVFAVAARHRSFTAAAAELHRTQGAISHRMKSLEAQIGVRLFHRRARGLELTAAGEMIAHKLNHAILEITQTIADLRRSADVRKIRVTLLPSVASRWLMPRLSSFHRLYPEIQVQVMADSRVLDLRGEQIDLAIRFGRGRYRGHSAIWLMGDRMLPVCSRELLAGRERITSIDALLGLPLLHDSGAEGDGSLSDWRSWLEQVGRADLPCHDGQRFSHAGLLIEAATHGLGLALARFSLVADYLASGTLTCPLALTTPTAYDYYLVASPERFASSPVREFSDWLHQEAQTTAALPRQIREDELRLRSILHLPDTAPAKNP